MIVRAANLNTRNMSYMKAVTGFDPETIKRLSGELVNAGADVINIQCSSFMTYMAGAGLDAALVDVLDTEIMKTANLIRSFRDEIIFSEADLEGTK
ncbi:MAG: hypothetical protein IEMM0007_1535 [bacterium]|nr:MAG: hypothetical protein IEMM0007_1535 [bacterium]